MDMDSSRCRHLPEHVTLLSCKSSNCVALRDLKSHADNRDHEKNFATFQYPLLSHPEQQSFRLLEIVGRNECGHIVCRLFPVDLNQPSISYLAISYTWDQAGPDSHHRIAINGHWFLVRQNVYDLLESLHASGEKSPLFIDAICIDQSSVHDKNTQVSHMGDIYYKAAKVIVWLGRLQTRLRDDLEALLGLYQGRRSDIMPDFQISTRQPQGLAVVKWIGTHPYWKRLWIVQELLLAQSIVLRASTMDIEWSLLLEWFSLDKFRNGELSLDTERASNLLRWRERLRSRYGDRRKSLCLIDAIISFGSQDCVDARDKLYGLLALSNVNMSPDYSKSTREVYLETLVAGMHEIITSPTLAVFAVKVGCDKGEKNENTIVRVWCAKLSNVFGLDVHSLDIPSWTISTIEPGVFLNGTKLPCIAFLYFGHEGCQACGQLSRLTTMPQHLASISAKSWTTNKQRDMHEDQTLL